MTVTEVYPDRVDADDALRGLTRFLIDRFLPFDVESSEPETFRASDPNRRCTVSVRAGYVTAEAMTELLRWAEPYGRSIVFPGREGVAARLTIYYRGEVDGD